MNEWELLNKEIEEKTLRLEESARDLRRDFMERIANAQSNQILVAIKALNTRLDAIEKRLPSEEEE